MGDALIAAQADEPEVEHLSNFRSRTKSARARLAFACLADLALVGGLEQRRTWRQPVELVDTARVPESKVGDAGAYRGLLELRRLEHSLHKARAGLECATSQAAVVSAQVE